MRPYLEREDYLCLSRGISRVCSCRGKVSECPTCRGIALRLYALSRHSIAALERGVNDPELTDLMAGRYGYVGSTWRCWIARYREACE